AECLRQLAAVFLGDRLDKENIETCQARVTEYLREKAALVVLDNFETVARDAEFLRSLSEFFTQVRVLMTSRELPHGLNAFVNEIPELPREEAMLLYRKRVVARGGDEPANIDDVNKLCTAVGDMPLAIELLAARHCAPAVLLEEVQKDHTIMSAGASAVSPAR